MADSDSDGEETAAALAAAQLAREQRRSGVPAEAPFARRPDAQDSDRKRTAAPLGAAQQAQRQADASAGAQSAATRMEDYLAQRRPDAHDSDSDGEETASALAAAQRSREQRRADERSGNRLVARLAALAASASGAGRWMEAIELYTRALAERPNDTELLALRASACARAGHYAAALHDGELMVRLTPDWYRGFQVRRHRPILKNMCVVCGEWRSGVHT
jgi:tetratricopeptide (TPR) repeat protein